MGSGRLNEGSALDRSDARATGDWRITGGGWPVEFVSGAAGAVLSDDPLTRLATQPGGAAEAADPHDGGAFVRVVEVTDRAVVLGASQRDDVFDAEAGARHETALVRRRSGGGAVFVSPGEMVWVDVVLPVSDPRWTSDVNVAFEWVGESWARALQRLANARGDTSASITLHRGGLVRSDWSSLVCFAGLGPGEVLWNGRKVVGIAQKRSRAGAWFQCGALLRWTPADLARVLRVPETLRARTNELDTVAAGLAWTGDEVREAFLASLPQR
jgi:lipoate---protein ligase